MIYHCTFKGCKKTSEAPRAKDGWSFLAKWGPGIPDGYYCREHVEALEALLVSGELEEAQRPRPKPQKH
ncbi:MAG: hypothetical protein C5B54_01915 [Acidobacteria bacterium]|nr:MAG: hypothetical protein C5B54_01915 [Acidobacteriota bacterium]